MRHIPLLILLVAGCDLLGDKPIGPGDDTGAMDGDGDGFSVGVDCDDADPEVHPGAAELCDGVDNDCDGVVDPPESLDASSWYADVDGDGYGDVAAGTLACEAASGQVADASDCDDGDAAVHPGATELCNGVDDDCDGATDPDNSADAPTWYADADGDGYGDPATGEVGCEGGSGEVTDGTDCDDGAASVNPGATEQCNGVDDDCDGATDPDSSADASRWYTDADGDGYGDVSTEVVACYAGSDQVSDATDCDDGDAAVHPAATELCDGVDNDCDGVVDPASSADASRWYRDADGDGYGDVSTEAVACYASSGQVSDATDCDDGDAAVHPGAVESCNGVDDDCDGATDPASSVDASRWYTDADGDGYGDASTEVVACYGSSGQVLDARDCDDADAAVNPLAVESCNGVDDDCDGATDPASSVDAVTWYSDVDGDGYGDASTGVLGCYGASDEVLDSTDCDDADAAVNPGAIEWCGDGVDDDCDGVDEGDDDCAPTGTSDSPDAWVAGSSGTLLGSAITVMEDCTGDAHAELILGSPSGGSAAEGRAWLFTGFPTDDTTRGTYASDHYFTGDATDDLFATALTGLPDLDSDGVAELVVGAPGHDGGGSEAGAVYLFPGPTGSTSSSSVSDASVVLYGEADDDQAGTMLADGGDLDGDGLDDLLIAAPGFDGMQTDLGAVYVAFGGGLATGTLGPGDQARFDGESAGDALSVAAGLGDVNGDGYADLGIGSPLADRNGTSAGTVWVWLGPLEPTRYEVAAAPLRIDGDSAGDGAGAALAGGDQDGDGVADLWVGATGSDAPDSGSGSVALFRGPFAVGALEMSDAFATITGSDRADGAGGYLSTGDFDADGWSDLAIAVPGAELLGSGQGGVFLFYGPITDTSMTLADAQASLHAGAGAVAGEGLAAFDVDEDGYDDIAYHVASSYNERIDLHVGGPRMPDVASAPDSATDDDGDGFSEDDGDCDDGDTLRAPDHPEVCGSGIDEDCDGYADRCAPSVSLTESDLDSLVTNDISGGWTDFGATVRAVGDLNGDEVQDLAVVDPEVDGDRGRVLVFFGPVPEGTHTGAIADVVITGDIPNDSAGDAVSNAGDLDGDGYDDLFVGASGGDMGESDEGWVAIYRGGPTLVGDLGPTDADWLIEGGVADRLAGWGGGGLDLNDDGYDDLIVGASGEDVALGTDAGMLAVIWGPISMGSHDLDSLADLMVYGSVDAEQLGAGTRPLGDLTGDGVDDLLVFSGGWEHQVASTARVEENLGRFLLFEGPLPGSGVLDEHDASAVLAVPGAGMERTWTVCDLTGDGLAELVLGLDEAEWAIVELAGTRGVVELPENLLARLTDPSVRIDEDYAAMACGDLDRDGIDDLALGFTSTSDAAGELRVFYGPVTSDLSVAWPDMLVRGDSNHRFATALEIADLDGDGFGDIITGIPSHNDTSNYGAFGVLRWGWTSVTESPAEPRSSSDDHDGDGYSIDDGDCHDGDASTYPGATEVCGDARDQDCDGLAPDCAPVGRRTEYLPSLQIEGYFRGVAGYLASPGDLNGDGLPELAVDGVYEELMVMESPLPLCGVAWPVDYAAGELTSTESYSGGSLELMPDIDGDGVDELIVNEGDGIFRVVDSTGGLDSRSLSSAAWSFEVVYPLYGVNGAAHGGAGFFAGDDGGLAMSSYEYNYYWADSEGAVYLFGVNDADRGTFTATDADVLMVGEVVGDLFGTDLRVMGDLDGDGLDEVAISALEDTPTGDELVYLWTSDVGAGSYTAADLPVKLRDVATYDRMFPWAPGDLDGDGLDDMALAFPYSSTSFVIEAGRVYLWSGAPPDGEWRPPPADLTINGEDRSEVLGAGVAENVDFDGDGNLDLVISSSYEFASSGDGKVLIWYGPVSLSGLDSTSGADGVIVSGEDWDNLGTGVVRAGDVDADGTDDLWVGTDDLPLLVLGGVR
jgi:hypothetical protein